MSTDIRVFVQWKEFTVFAGEEIQCTITFKNVAPLPGSSRSPVRGSKSNGERQRKFTASQNTPKLAISRNSSFISQVPSVPEHGHRPTLSLSTPSAVNGHPPAPPTQNVPPTCAHRHGRSLSILSMGTDIIGDEGHARSISTTTARRPMRGHGRSASLQVVPGKVATSPFIGQQASPPFRFPPKSLPLNSAPFSLPDSQNEVSLPPQPSRRMQGRSTALNTPSIPVITRGLSGPIPSTFKFPPEPPSDTVNLGEPQVLDSAVSPGGTLTNKFSSKTQGEQPVPSSAIGLGLAHTETLSPVARILSGSSMNGTPRSSVEFYSMSNHSSETLASEYVPASSVRLLGGDGHSRRESHLNASNIRREPETLMMGYAQIMGSFTLDGSLVNQAPFEEVKRKGVLGSQAGGGVVGVERSKRDSGLFGALGWGNIGESLGGLLGGGELSSMREMKGIASAKTVPLLSTPQSILFVDLRLAPGESRSYSYSFTLPRGLPPTHKGRALKISYHLTIGTQRPSSGRDQQHVKHVNIPFRILGSVTGRGEILGHDLMSPYIILRDQAQTAIIDEPARTNIMQKKSFTKPAPTPEQGFSEFLDYADKLLERPPQNPNMGLLSPTESGPRRLSVLEEPQSMKEAIDLAILRSNVSTSSNQSTNRFEIARSGRRVAVIMLARPAYRLGETISAVVDFTNADIPCYSVSLALETSERVDPAIALRSASSIHRVTRRIHASASENALFARRLSFSPTIPPNATPEFITSGISLEWKVRIEFVTPRLTSEAGYETEWGELLEEASRDDRGEIWAPVERLFVESFEVAVPVRVYGTLAGTSEVKDDGEGLPI
ncbi:Rgp1-domain-containing protein [Patellaria atrata CBS 101060]|uniref:Rgp1-domain-containing protein n=1 Tax=Patellaria atrata CBS 101060 TaxID=1346257 RepID=A0A9P4VRM1_9PEZI|nr:Rgp1-domain-containing protein [Patellaria atrata CBS 101060]